MLHNIKSKIVIAIAVIIIIIGIIYQIKKSNEELEEINYQNLIVQNVQETEEIVEKNTAQKEYIKIHVTGQVKISGIIELESGSRISDAIEKAGGITEFANLDEVNLAYCLEDGQKLYIPSIEEKDVKYITQDNGENIIQDTKASRTSKVVNINKADKEDLENMEKEDWMF